MPETDQATTERPQAPSATLGFVKLVVEDLPSMQAFFEDVLNYRVNRTIEFPEITELMMTKGGADGGFTVVLYFNKDGRKLTLGDAHGPLGFYVRDVDAAFAHAVSCGARIKRPPFDAGSMRVAFVLTPEGHEIEFISVKR